jgi:hypothetical protein
MSKRKEKLIKDHSDAELFTLIVWGHTRINAIEQEREEIKANIKQWRKILRERKKK